MTDTEGSQASIPALSPVHSTVYSILGWGSLAAVTDTEGSQASIPALLPVHSTVYSILGWGSLAAVTDTEGSQASIPALSPVHSTVCEQELKLGFFQCLSLLPEITAKYGTHSGMHW